MKNFILILITLFFSGWTFAADEGVTFNVPRSDLGLPKTQAPMNALGPKYFSFEVSNWTPESLAQESRLPDTTEFAKSGSPKFAFQFISAGESFAFGHLSTKLGISYLQLQRDGFFEIESSGYTVTQKVNLYQFLIGAEWRTEREYFSFLSPYADLAIQPTWLQSQKSEFGGGLSELHWPLFGAAGLSFNARSLGHWIGVEEMAFHVSVERTQNLEDSKLNGTGVAVGTKIGWN